MDRATIPDISYYQQNVNFETMKARGAPGVIIRASWGLTQDTRHEENRTKAFNAGMPIIQYHYLDWRWDVLQEADFFSRVVTTGAKQLKIYPVCDLEMDPSPYNYKASGEIIDLMPETRKLIGSPEKPLHYDYEKSVFSMSNTQVQDSTRKFLERVEFNVGTIPIIYSGFYYWQQWMTTSPEWLKYKFWLAWYANESYIKVPPPFTSWWLWQYTSHAIGSEWGAESGNIDLSNYHDTAAQFLVDYGQTPPPEPPTAHTHVCKICGLNWNTTPIPPVPTFPKYQVKAGKKPYVRSSPQMIGADPSVPGNNILLPLLSEYIQIEVDNYQENGYSHFLPIPSHPNGGYIASTLIEVV